MGVDACLTSHKVYYVNFEIDCALRTVHHAPSNAETRAYPDTESMGAPTILLLDDDPTVRLVLHTMLERRDVEVLESEGEKSAVAQCEQHPAGIDLLVADVVLRDNTGPGVVRRVKYLQPHLRILFISSFTINELDENGLLEARDLLPGSVEFLAKPFTSDEFLERVDGLLRGRPNGSG